MRQQPPCKSNKYGLRAKGFFSLTWGFPSPGGNSVAVEFLFPCCRLSPKRGLGLIRGGTCDRHPVLAFCLGGLGDLEHHQETRSAPRVRENRSLMDKAPASSSMDEMTHLMQELGLREDDLDGVVFDEKKAPRAAERWLEIAIGLTWTRPTSNSGSSRTCGLLGILCKMSNSCKWRRTCTPSNFSALATGSGCCREDPGTSEVTHS